MHGCISTSVLVVNAEIGSMGGVVEGGVGISNKTSPGRAALEKVQAEIRQEYDVREERKRELEFLEKGGNPLDFTFGTAASVSIRSTSFTDQHPDLFVTSEAKGSVAFTASTHGDSVESSGRPGVPPCEPSSADNLLLFDAEHDPSEGDRNLLHPSRSNVVASEQSARVDGSTKARELGDSAAFGLPRKAYKRRYRSHPNRDGTRSSSTDLNPTRGSHISSLPSRHGPRDVKGLVSDAENHNTSSSCNSKHTSPVDGAFQKNVMGQQDMELDGQGAVESIRDMTGSVSVDAASDATASENALGKKLHKQSLSSAKKNSVQLDANGPEEIHIKPSSVIRCQPSLTAIKVENQSNLSRMNGFSSKIGNGMKNIAHNSSAFGMKNLDSESSCAETNLSVGVGNDIGIYSEKGNVNSNGNNKNETLGDASLIIEGGEIVNENRETEVIDCSASVKESVSQVENGFAAQTEEELSRSGSALKIEVKDQIAAEGMEDCGLAGSESERKAVNPSGDNPAPQNGISCAVRHRDSLDTTISGLPEAGMFTKACAVPHESPTSGSSSELGNNVDEDSILREAEIIEAKRKRIMELSMATCPTEIRRKSHWDYVLEEIAWLANDFAQERIWKVTAAAQLCYRAAFTCQLRKQGKSSGIAVKKVSRTLAKAVMEFWHSVEERHEELEQKNQKDGTLSVQAYAVRFLKYNSSNMSQTHADVPLTPDRISDSGVLDLSWEENSTEEDLFYTIRPGALETYRKSVESHVDLRKRIGSGAQEEVETSACGAVSGNAYDEYEGETSTYDRSVAFESIKSSRFGQKKWKQLAIGYVPRSYEVGSEEYDENKFVTQQSSLLAKPPGSSLNVSIPTKRMRTASRRVISPFNAGTSGFIQLPNKTDASSGDTNSLQDDLSTLGGGSLVPNGMEVESIGDFEKQFPLDFEEVSRKPKKKKKAKHLNVEYKQRWQVDSSFQHEQFQRDHLKKRSETHQLESNGSSGLLGQPTTKRPKIMRQSQDNSFDNITPFGGSIPSPVASQMSNMSNPNKFIKMLGGRDRGRKTKALKMLAGQPSSGSPWSLFEDQALVVLVHDMGPNWELVSDALNSTLRFKCIFRKAKECKERHNSLMDRTSGDGADSAEDSGSSQPYPSTLPGIPKGSARQLFQRLQGPMEEDTLKSHFEKIIVIGQRQQYRKTQDPKQLEQLHSSHTIALSQVCPNNLNGVAILTPLELCDATSLGADMLSFGYQGPQSSGVTFSNQGAVNPTLPSSGASSAQQGSPNMMIGNNFSSSPASLNSSVRDGRYVVPRSASLSADEQQRMQQYNHIISGRNMPQSNIASPGALPGTDRGVRIFPGGNGMGMVSGNNRSMPMARPGLQGIVNSGSMVSPGIQPANMHSGQGSSMLRPRESLHMIRPSLSQDSQRQMMVPDLQNSQGVSHFGGLSSPFPNQTASPPVSSYPVHHQPPLPISPQPPQVLSAHHPHFQGPANHAPTPQQQAYAIRLAKERQLQHRFLQQQQSQQQQQFAMSNSLMPHAQSQPQLPISTPMQNSSQVQAQTSSPPASLSPLTPTSSMNSIPQHKHPTPTQGIVRNAQAGGSGLTNQTGKQRQRQQQQFSQANRQHPQQRQQSQAQLQAKVAKGVGRGNLVMQQNIPVDPSLLNGVSTNPGYSCLEKGESATNIIQNQGYSALHAGPSRQYVPAQSSNQSLSQQKMYSGQASSSSSSKHSHQLGTQSNHSNQGHVSPAAPGLSALNQSVPSSTMAVNHQREPSQQKSGSLNQPATQRVVQANRQINTNPSDKQPARDSNADQHPTSRSSEMDTIGTLPRGAKTGANGAEVVSLANVNKWPAPDQLLDSNASSSVNLSPLVSTSSNMNEPMPQAGQGPGQRTSPSGVISSRHETSAQWQQQSSQVPQTHSPVPQPEQHQEQQTLPMPHSHQQAQPVQAGNGSMYGRSSDPRLE